MQDDLWTLGACFRVQTVVFRPRESVRPSGFFPCSWFLPISVVVSLADHRPRVCRLVSEVYTYSCSLTLSAKIQTTHTRGQGQPSQAGQAGASR